MSKQFRRLASVAGLAAIVATVLALPAGSTAATDWSKVSSAKAGGGFDALVAAAKKEGTLNVIALPRDWANYGELIDTFKKKYGLKVTEITPDVSSADEIAAIKKLGSSSRAPDVVDVGASFADPTTSKLYAPYKVQTWSTIQFKDANGRFAYDYGGYIGIGCNMKLVKVCPTSIKALAGSAYKGQVALNGNPTKAGAAFGAVFAASLANGGSLDGISKGIDFFAKLNASGNFNKTEATPATVQNGQTPIVLDWDYLQASGAAEAKKKGITWKINVPTDGAYAGYYVQAISAKAPHPAAARLWEEFLFSDQGQNLWLKGGARPSRMAAMTKAGTIDKKLAAKLPKAPAGTVKLASAAQLTKAQATVATQWPQKVS